MIPVTTLSEKDKDEIVNKIVESLRAEASGECPIHEESCYMTEHVLKSSTVWYDQYDNIRFDFRDPRMFCNFFGVSPTSIIEFHSGGEVENVTIHNAFKRRDYNHESMTMQVDLPNAILTFFLGPGKYEGSVSAVHYKD